MWQMLQNSQLLNADMALKKFWILYCRFFSGQMFGSQGMQKKWLRRISRAGEIAHWLRVLATTIPDDPGLITSTHMVAYNCL